MERLKTELRSVNTIDNKNCNEIETVEVCSKDFCSSFGGQNAVDQIELSPESFELFEHIKEAEQNHISQKQEHRRYMLSSSKQTSTNSKDFNSVLKETQDSTKITSYALPTPNVRLKFSDIAEEEQKSENHDITLLESNHAETVQSVRNDECIDESERLARQLMEEEEMLLCERIQQEQLRVLAEMRMASSDDLDDNLHVVDRIAQVEEMFDPDEMTYDELLELGEHIGDVKQERWRIEGRKAVSSLNIIVYKTPEELRNEEKPEWCKILHCDESTQCVICQHSYVSGDNVKILPCKHAFHSDCIDLWLKDHDTCVMCKQSILNNNV